MKIYTRQGDSGRTRLFGGPDVGKDDARVDAYGSLDELSASLGVVLALDSGNASGTAELAAVQADLLVIGARLAAANPGEAVDRGTIPVLGEDRVGALEAWIDRLDEELPPLDAFILPGGGEVGAHLHVARTVCRRAERAVAAIVSDQPDLSERIVPYINRLSDLLFTLARTANQRAGRPEARWTPLRQRPSGQEGGAER